MTRKSFWTPTGDTDADAIHDNVAGEIAAITEKVSPVNADLVVIEDSEDSNAKKRAQLGNLPGGGGGGGNSGARISDPSGSDQAINTTTDTVVTFDTEDWDTDGYADLGTNNDRLTVSEAGLYLIVGQLGYNSSLGQWGDARLYVNGSLEAIERLSPHANVSRIIQVSIIYSASANDYFQLVAHNSDGADLFRTSWSPWLSIARL